MLLPHSKTLAISISDVTRPTPRTKGAVTDITKTLASEGTFFQYRRTPKTFLSVGDPTPRLQFFILCKEMPTEAKVGGGGGGGRGGGDCSESRHCALLLVAGRTKRLRGSARDDVCYDGKGRKLRQSRALGEDVWG